MPRSKRNKQIELAKTKKRGIEWKKRLFEEVRSCVDKYENVFIFSVSDMRNNKMKTVREQWKHSRFFIGKNKIMAMALGRIAEEEYRPNLHKLGQQIKGQRGLLFSNKPIEEVLSWFRSYSEGDYARSGNTATETVHLPAGPLTKFPHNLEPYLRQLGLPTTLEKGIIHLIKDHEVCKTGDILTPETAKILKLLGYEMAEFHFTIDYVWSKDGSFMQFTENIDIDSKENKKQKKKLEKSSEHLQKNNSVEDEEMEIQQIDEESHDSDEDEEESREAVSNASDDTPGIVKSALNSIIAATSTPKVDRNEMSDLNQEDNKSILKCNIQEMSEKIDDENGMEKVSEKAIDKCNMEEIAKKSPNEASKVSEEKAPIKRSNKACVSTKTPKTNKKENNEKRESLLKTPDANTSQDSPIFRELRNRSVKFSRKKK